MKHPSSFAVGFFVGMIVTLVGLASIGAIW